jgi:hexosaminidase
MKKLIFLIVVLLIYKSGPAQTIHAQNKIHIIPEPVSVTAGHGHFSLKRDTRILVENPSATDVADLFTKMLDVPTGYHLKEKKSKSSRLKNAISLRINSEPDSRLGDEGYTLQVSAHKVVITANKPQGIFYGIQSLMQLLPPEIESDSLVKNKDWNIPCVTVLDYPRFKWRGLMLDVSRHFFSKKFVEEYIDEMAKYKFNVFHWHLTDDQGWRLQITGLPKLTGVGAWRVPRTGRWKTLPAPQSGEKASDGGYYTTKDIHEIVKYASRRFVTIVPEVDVPAHSLALIASYPNLSCTKEQYPVWPQYQPRGIDNVLCVANDSTWIILNKIFTQIATLFPGKYIHVGGDEANRSFWMKDPRDIALMQEEGIKTPAGLQSYFEKKLEKLILSKGKKMIGWDEILEGGLAPEAAVMSWRGEKGGIKAASMGHQVVMAPSGYNYINRGQGNPLVEPVAPGVILLSKCYHYDPVPKGVNPAYVLGGEGCLWTEEVPNYRHAEYLTWPRALALSEVFWSPENDRNWDDFIRRVQSNFKYLRAAEVKYATSIYDPLIDTIKYADNSIKVKLSTQIPGLDIFYSFDGTNPDNFYPRYAGKPLPVPKGATEIRVITYRDGRPVGRQINYPLTREK